MSPEKPLWTPDSPQSTPISIYREYVNHKFNLSLRDSHELHTWSVARRHDFWIDLWSYVGLQPALPTNITQAYDDSKTIKDVPEWFSGVHLNYTENVLSGRDANAIALIGLREGQSLDGEQWTWAQLSEHVRQLRSALVRSGVRRGDRVGALMSNSNWTIAVFLATAAIGAIFSSVSSEMGVDGCISRFQQIDPKVLFVDSHQTYKAKRRSLEDKIKATLAALRVQPLLAVVPVGTRDTFGLPSLSDLLAKSSTSDRLEYLRLPFSAPLLILFSSGTTGAPKCMVHQVGLILQLKKIALLHNSLTPKDIVFQYSSTSWVLWNIMNGHLAAGATLICYDGSPLYPDASTKLKILQHHKVTYFGTSPRYCLELESSSINVTDYDLSALRMVTTTGSPLTTDQFRWFYRAFPARVHLSSVAGGTEICSSWLASDAAGPVYAGEMQMIALGMDVDVGDPETGASVKASGAQGELICRTPFPSAPIYFWNDSGNKKYNEAYFERFPALAVWAQHDWIQFNPATNGAQILGRSDGTLNPSGIRFGSAEIYNIIESPVFSELISDSLCVGRRRPHDRDEAVFLFLVMRPLPLPLRSSSADSQEQQQQQQQQQRELTPAIKDLIVSEIRQRLSPRHVPAFILQTSEIPWTINGKKVEIAVKKILSGETVVPSATVANPECLKLYYQYRDLEEKRASRL